MSTEKLAIIVSGLLGMFYIHKYFATKTKLSSNNVIVSNNEVKISENNLKSKLADSEAIIITSNNNITLAELEIEKLKLTSRLKR
jgi:hypothetical protein